MRDSDGNDFLGVQLTAKEYFDACLKVVCDICKTGDAMVEPKPRQLLMGFDAIQYTNKGWCVPKDPYVYYHLQTIITNHGELCNECNKEN